MSFGGTSIREKVLKERVEGLYQKLSQITCQTPEAFHFDDFELRDGELYCKGKSMPLKKEGGKLRLVLIIAKTLGEEGHCELGFNIPRVN